MKNIFFLGFIIIYLVSSCRVSKTICSSNPSQLLQAIEDTLGIEIKYDKKAIPESIYKVSKKCYNEDLFLADYQSPYNSTDMYVKNIPSKRLTFIGFKRESNLGIICYERGGYVQLSSCIIYKINDKKKIESIVLIDFNTLVNNFKEFNLSITNKEFQVHK